MILVKKSQDGFLDGFEIFWKKKKFFFQFFLIEKFYIVILNAIYIFSHYWSAEF